MSSNQEALFKAVSQAAQEVKLASADVSAGASPNEAFSEKVKCGPENVATEVHKLTKSPTESNPTQILLSFGPPTLRWSVLSSGNVIIPIVVDSVGSIVTGGTLYEDEKKRQRDLERMAKAGKHAQNMQNLMEMGAKVVSTVGAPASTTPYFALALRPNPNILGFLPIIVTLASLYWIKKFY